MKRNSLAAASHLITGAIGKTILCAALALGMVSSAFASLITVNSGTYVGAGNLGGPGTGRAQGFQALNSFSISSVGIEADLITESYDVVIYASPDGGAVGGVLGSASAVLGGNGFVFHDMAINFSFTAGNYYIVNWRPSDGSFNVNGNNIAYYADAALPVNVGPFRLVQGIEGFNATNSVNSLHPNMRYDVVPEPGTLALLGLGLLGLGVSRRRKA